MEVKCLLNIEIVPVLAYLLYVHLSHICFSIMEVAWILVTVPGCAGVSAQVTGAVSSRCWRMGDKSPQTGENHQGHWIDHLCIHQLSVLLEHFLNLQRFLRTWNLNLMAHKILLMMVLYIIEFSSVCQYNECFVKYHACCCCCISYGIKSKSNRCRNHTQEEE